MFHLSAIALTIGEMSFSMPTYPLVVGHTIDIPLSECTTCYLIHDDTADEAFLCHVFLAFWVDLQTTVMTSRSILENAQPYSDTPN